MHSFFCPAFNISDQVITITDFKEIHHFKNVLRIKLKEGVSVFDGQGNEYDGLVKTLSKEVIVIEIKKKKIFLKDFVVDYSVACALVKNQKMDEIIDKLTQLGVSRIIPLKTKRTIVNLDEQATQRRLRRWNDIAVSAAKQSKRKTVPVIEPVCDFNNLISRAGEFSLKIIPTLTGERKKIKEVLNKNKKKLEKILIIIGPEGDFDPDELCLARDSGCIPVTLGSLVLRVETACLSIASFINFNLG